MHIQLINQHLDQMKIQKFEDVLERVSEALRDSLDENLILNSVTQEITKVLNLGSCQIEFYDADKTIATIHYEYSLEMPKYLGYHRKISDYSEVYTQLLEKNYMTFSEILPYDNAPITRITRMAYPIYDDKGIIGNLWANKAQQDIFTDAEIKLLKQVANHCAIAIRQARLYKAANLQVEELAKVNKLKDDFLKTISHELKTPISSILLATETMNKLLINKVDHDSDIFKKVFKIFKDSSKKQNNLINDLLTICFIDSKKNYIKNDNINLNALVSELSQLTGYKTNKHNQNIIFDLSEKEILIKSDTILISRVINELINNAIKYTPSHHEICIKTEINESYAYFIVSNTGVTIPPDEQALIFNQFYRIPNNDPWKYGGTGLGLAIVSKLSVILGTEIKVTSGDNKTSFSLKIPI